MVKNRAAKKATRERMNATGEVYSVAKKSATKKLKVFGYDRVLEDPDVESVFTGDWDIESAVYGSLRRQMRYRMLGYGKVDEEDYAAAVALMPYNYGWYPTAGFYRYKGWERVKLNATQDGVTAREGEIAPWAAVFLGLGQPLYPTEPAFIVGQLHRYHFGIYHMIVSAWEGDVSPLADYGHLLGTLGRTYFYHVPYYIEAMRKWMNDNGIDIPEEFVTPVNAKGIPYENKFNYETYYSLIPVWKSLTQEQREDFLSAITDAMRNQGSVKESKVIYSTYSNYPPVEPVVLEVGDKVKFRGIGTKMDVRAVSDRFVILTMTTKQGERYSIIDWREGAIGAHDHYEYPVRTDEEVAKVMDALTEHTIKLSFRNRAQLVIERVWKA